MFRKFPELRNTEKGNRFGHNEDDTDDDEASSEEESLTWSDQMIGSEYNVGVDTYCDQNAMMKLLIFS